MDGVLIEDEFGSCSLADVALAVGHADSDEDRELAIAAFLRRLASDMRPRPGLGHNNPPLGEELDEELRPYIVRHDKLIASASAALIGNDDDAGKVVDLIAMLRAFEIEIDDARKTRVKPFVDAQHTINNRFNRLKLDVSVARQGESGRGGLRGLIEKWDDQQKAKAAEATEKAEREAAAKEIAAQSAREQIEKAAAAGRGVVSAELQALRLQDEAEHARIEAEAIVAPPTRGQLGQVSRKREIGFDIVDPLAYATWLLQQPGLAGNLLQALRTIAGHQLRGLGVDVVARGLDIPGIVARVETGGAVVRR